MSRSSVQRLVSPPDPETDLKRDAIYEQLLLDIICGDLAAGEWLDESALAGRYRAGRAGIRDALSRLALEGLVERRPRLGTVVASPSFFELQQVFELRVQIEGQCAALAARNARPNEIDVDRRGICRRRSGHRAVGLAFAGAPRSLLPSGYGSGRAQHLARANAHHAAQQRAAVLALHLPRRPVETVKGEIAGHLKVAAAIAAHDPVAAQAAMRSVLERIPGDGARAVRRLAGTGSMTASDGTSTDHRTDRVSATRLATLPGFRRAAKSTH